MSSPKNLSLLTIALFSAAACLCLGIFLTVMDMPLEGGAIAVIGFGPAYLYLDRRHTPGLLIGPSVFLYLFHATGYSIGPLAQRYIINSEIFIEEGMVLAQWGAVLGLATYALVYHIVFRKVAYRFRNDASPNTSPIESKWVGYTLLLLVISVLFLFYGHLSGATRRIGVNLAEATPQTHTVHATFTYVQFVIFFFLGSVAVRRRGWWIVLAAFVLLIYAGFNTLEGNRGPLLSSFLMLATGAVLAGFSVRKALFSLCIWILILIPLAGVVDFYRNATSALEYDEGLLERVNKFYSARQDLGALESMGAKTANQALIYAISAMTVDRVMVMTPDVIPHAGFENLDALFYVYIPAIIAPNRPEISDGNNIAFSYGVGGGPGSGSYLYIPSVGEGYRRFGWVGIPLMYALSGIIFGTACAICWTKRQRREWAAMLAFLVLQAPAVWGFTLNYLVYFALFVVPKYYIYFFVLRKLQDVFTSSYKTIRRPGYMHRSGDTWHQVRDL